MRVVSNQRRDWTHWTHWMLDTSWTVRPCWRRHPLKTRYHLGDDALGHLPRPLRQSQVRLGDRILPQPSSQPAAVPSFRRTPRGRDVLELLGDFLQGAVDVKLRTLAEGLLADGTEINAAAPPSSVPVGRDAPLTEAMSTWGRDGVLEDLETDGARELILTQKCSSQRHH